MSARKSFVLRLDPAMHDALQQWADDELRSLNAQIEYALRDALRRAGRPMRAATNPTTPTAPSSPEATSLTDGVAPSTGPFPPMAPIS